MLTYPQIDPVLLQIGPLKIHWYGFMYLVGFVVGWWLGQQRSQRPDSPLTSEQVSDLLFYLALGVVLGGRLGYILFYDPFAYLTAPIKVFYVWQGGMSFHGGLMGVLIAVAWFSYKIDKPFFAITDFIAPLIPPGLGAGRIGNFINGELWGCPTEMPWGMVFPYADNLPRHPSQLYQAALEGVALFLILWFFSQKSRPTKAVSGLFLITYAVFRFLVEFVREPDKQLGYLAFGWLTMGQLLCVPMLLAGIGLIVWAYQAVSTSSTDKTSA